MNFTDWLSATAVKSDSLVCVGLDPVLEKMPTHLRKVVNIFDFNRQIIDATADLVCAYKPNSAFYEAYGPAGIEQLKLTSDYIKNKKLPLIIDAKRADIGSTNEGHAKFIFEYLGADAVTLNPYLGREALAPFFEYPDKGLIILCRTSNPGAGEIQDLPVGDGHKLYEVVAQKVKDDWNKNDNCLLVVGATYPAELAKLRQALGEKMFFLVPGVGAQGGDIEATIRAGINSAGQGLIINSGRGIIYASVGNDFAKAAADAAKRLKDEINKYRRSP